MRFYQWVMDSPVGPLYLIASNHGLRGLYWNKQSVPMVEKLENEHIIKTTIQLKEYFDGKRKNFNVKLDLLGTDFQIAIWKELYKVPYGTTKTYTEMATKIGNAKAVRAVGTANRKNPICIIVPCHRIVGLNDNLAGYSGGLEIKQKLIIFEKLNSLEL